MSAIRIKLSTKKAILIGVMYRIQMRLDDIEKLQKAAKQLKSEIKDLTEKHEQEEEQ
ncbi:MAG: hypothetical protein NWE89_04720 [Candidatus Bathyarchaeota archaeon]|nr:hypothetical protein [Candidatus Bathyarchaeota archaeon]